MAQEKMLNITNLKGNANQNHSETSPSVRMAKIKNTREQMLARMQRKWNPFALLCRNVNWCSHCGKQYAGSLKN